MVQELDEHGAARETERTSTCLALACGSMVVVMALTAVGGYWAYQNVRRVAAQVAYSATEKLLAELPIEDQERREILLEVARVRDGFRDGELDRRAVGRFFEELAEGPLVPLAAVSAVERLVLAPSGLDFERKIEGQIHLERVARGVHEGRISPEQALEVLRPIERSRHDRGGERATEQDESRPRGLRVGLEHDGWSIDIEEHPSDEQVLGMIEAARATADRAEVPVEPFEVDLVAEVRRAVDEAFR